MYLGEDATEVLVKETGWVTSKGILLYQPGKCWLSLWLNSQGKKSALFWNNYSFQKRKKEKRMKKEVIANNFLSYYSSTAQKLIKAVGVVLFAVWESSVHPFSTSQRNAHNCHECSQDTRLFLFKLPCTKKKLTEPQKGMTMHSLLVNTLPPLPSRLCSNTEWLSCSVLGFFWAWTEIQLQEHGYKC